MGEQYRKAISLQEITKASKQCCKGVGHKRSAQLWKLERCIRSESLQNAIKTGKYHPGHGKPFKIYEPKERDILPPLFRDRVWQRDMCNNGVYYDMTKSLMYDCPACRKNMGTEFAIFRMAAALEKYYRTYGDNKGYVDHWDVKKFFPSTYHEDSIDILDKKITEIAFKTHLFEVINSFEDPRPKEVIANDPKGIRGTGLGSPISQLVQLSILEGIDRQVTRMPDIFTEKRFMDDIIIVAHTKEALQKAGKIVVDECNKYGLKVINKSGTLKLSKGFYYLKKKFILTDTGKVLIIPEKEKFYKERRTLKKLKMDLDNGIVDMSYIHNHYESWISGLMYCDCRYQIFKMDNFYTKLFNERPVYKCMRKGRKRKCVTKH